MNLRKEIDEKLFQELAIDCESCFGLCCVALYFSTSEGFPEDKIAGKPCINLNDNFTCKIHSLLRMQGLKGCTTYDCFGAGQKIAKQTFQGKSWSDNKQSEKLMFDAFVVMRQLHEMMWYLIDVKTFVVSAKVEDKLDQIFVEVKKLRQQKAEDLLVIDLEELRSRVNSQLREVVGLIQQEATSKIPGAKQKKKLPFGFDFIGKDLTKNQLVGATFAGAMLIAANLKGCDLAGANLIGADLRDTNICGADLSNAIFLTQGQVNSAKGDGATKLPSHLARPSYWAK